MGERDRGELDRQHIGQVLAKTPAGVDGVWPNEPIRDLLEDLQDEQIEKGLSLAVFNSPGVTSRGLDEGGVSEQALAAKYRADAEVMADSAPRSAALLRNLARAIVKTCGSACHAIC